MPKRSVDEEVNRAVRLIHLLRRSKLKVHRALEIGSSTGAMMAALKDIYGDDTNVFGVEPNDAYRNFAIETFKKIPDDKAGKLYSSLAKVPKSPKFDLVIMSHVLEHIADPRKALKQMHNLLRKDGMMLLEVPNFFGGPSDPMMFPHIHVFYRETIIAMLEEENFQVLTFETMGSISPFWVAPQHMTITAIPVHQEFNKSNILERYSLYQEHLAFVKSAAQRSAPRYEVG